MLTREIFRQWLLIAVPVSRTRFATIFCLSVTKTGRQDRQKIYLSKCFVTAWTPGELLTGKYGWVQHKLLRLSGKAVLLPKYVLWEGRLINSFYSVQSAYANKKRELPALVQAIPFKIILLFCFCFCFCFCYGNRRDGKYTVHFDAAYAKCGGKIGCVTCTNFHGNGGCVNCSGISHIQVP